MNNIDDPVEGYCALFYIMLTVGMLGVLLVAGGAGHWSLLWVLRYEGDEPISHEHDECDKIQTDKGLVHTSSSPPATRSLSDAASSSSKATGSSTRRSPPFRS